MQYRNFILPKIWIEETNLTNKDNQLKSVGNATHFTRTIITANLIRFFFTLKRIYCQSRIFKKLEECHRVLAQVLFIRVEYVAYWRWYRLILCTEHKFSPCMEKSIATLLRWLNIFPFWIYLKNRNEAGVELVDCNQMKNVVVFSVVCSHFISADKFI